ncbi:MAG: histidinol-phosphatase HisJ family protein [Bacteroidales bacterium]|nr:histidinol-phosphatase HisJ family protein [Bacteroidales bacterium]
MRYFDTHTHSQFSPDSLMNMESAAALCLKKGLAGLVFTDHMDIDTPTGVESFMFDPGAQQAEAERVSREYNVELLKGIELGLQPGTVEKSRERLSPFTFDTVILSVHSVDGMDPYHQPVFFEDKDHIRAYGRYLETILECITKYRDFDILGHYDYITRYAPYRERNLRYRDFPDLLDSILSYLATNGKALEINTNTYRAKYKGATAPDEGVFKRFRELKGEFVSIGSDAHSSDRICENFDLFGEFAKSCGFRYLTMFRGRKASLTAI